MGKVPGQEQCPAELLLEIVIDTEIFRVSSPVSYIIRFCPHWKQLDWGPNQIDLCILTWLVLSSISLVDLVVEPHVSNSHAVLSQSSSFVGADGGCGTQSLNGLEILHQAVLTSHTLGC